MQSQTPPHVAGEYYLSGVMETASGFKLNEDSTFEFFFSQGALDRFGKGTYKITGNTIIFNSHPAPGQDFELVKSSRQPGNKTTIRIADPNKNILSYVYSRVKAGKEIKEGFADSHGDAVYEISKPDTVELMFEFCPEKIAVFPVADKTHNYFEFRFNPWLFEYFFNNFTLEIADGELHGAHPLMQEKKFVYTKQAG
ncbi:MAG: hypothetical protein J7497_09030 [Chitinophagaceae bacterium]|nr:hypothetical protein [Chitinophagaceae bacterium]